MKLLSLEFEVPFVSFIFILLIVINYFSKKRIELLENRPYEVILICSLVLSIIDTFLHFLSSIYDYQYLITDFYSVINFSGSI